MQPVVRAGGCCDGSFRDTKRRTPRYHLWALGSPFLQRHRARSRRFFPLVSQLLMVFLLSSRRLKGQHVFHCCSDFLGNHNGQKMMWEAPSGPLHTGSGAQGAAGTGGVRARNSPGFLLLPPGSKRNKATTGAFPQTKEDMMSPLIFNDGAATCGQSQLAEPRTAALHNWTGTFRGDRAPVKTPSVECDHQ